MRQIKSRGKRVGNGEWVYGSIVSADARAWIIPTSFRLSKTNTGSNEHICSAYEVTPESVGEFTGIHDKNGVDIYEGDKISKQSFGYDSKIFDTCIVTHRQAYCDFTLNRNNCKDIKLYKALHKYLEVIGNIHNK